MGAINIRIIFSEWEHICRGKQTASAEKTNKFFKEE